MSPAAPLRAPRPVVTAALGRLGQRNLVLVGMMGAGKSGVGRILARRLRRELVDTDDVVAATAGADIPTIFAAEGEAGFRQREVIAVASVMARPALVVATGGGAILLPENRAALRRGIVVWLQAPPEELLRRVGGRRAGLSRPLLRDSEPLARLRGLLADRTPLYAEAAHLCLQTQARTPVQVAVALLVALSEFPAGGPDQ